MFYSNNQRQNGRQPGKHDAQKAFNGELAAQKNGSVAFASAVAVEVMLSGKGDATKVQRALDAVYSSRYGDHGAYRRALDINDAVRGCDLSLKALSEFFAPRWNSGFDVPATDMRKPVYDSTIRNALVREGIILGYALPPALRPHLRIIAHQAAESVKASPKFQEGAQALENGKPLSILERADWDEVLKKFDREVLLGMDALRRATVEVGMAARSDGLRGHSFIGPTGWSLACAERLIMCDFLGALTNNAPDILVDRYIALGKNFKFREYYLKNEQEGLRQTMRFLVELPQVLGGVKKIIEEKTSLAKHRSIVSALADFEPADETTRSYLSAPPPYSILYKTDADGPEGAKKVELLFVHSMASIQVSDIQDPQRVCRWTADINGDIRTWPRGNSIPLDAGDIGVSSEEFQALSRELEGKSLAVLRKLGTVWERFPSLYGLSLSSTEMVKIVESGDSLSFQVATADGENLLAAVTWELGRNEGAYQIATHEDPAQQNFIVTITPLAGPHERAACEAPELEEHKNEGQGLTRRFVKEYCSDYYELLRQLKKFGVTVEHGKGSHDCLCLGGYKVAVSQNQRDGTLLMNRHVIRQVLGCLRIPESDFVLRVSTKSF